MFKYYLRVAYRDITAGNHVYYARYLDWLEVVRNEAFRQAGSTLLSWQDRGVILPVLECSVKYLAFARFDDWVEIRLWVQELGRVQVVFSYQVLRGDRKILEATTRHAVMDANEKPVRMPSELTQLLESWKLNA